MIDIRGEELAIHQFSSCLPTLTSTLILTRHVHVLLQDVRASLFLTLLSCPSATIREALHVSSSWPGECVFAWSDVIKTLVTDRVEGVDAALFPIGVEAGS